MSIFKAYDIRGVYPDEVNEEIYYRIGRAAVVLLGCAEMVVGYDMRESSKPLHHAFIQGVCDQGCNVVSIAEATTPLLYFAGRNKPACAIITASHNPKHYNGIKLCGANAAPLSLESGLLKIKALVEENNFDEPTHKGMVSDAHPLEAFLDENLRALKTKKPFHIIVDAANGMGGLTYSALRERKLPFTITPLYFTPDGSFPHHEANPLKKETLVDLQAQIATHHADLGMALDGDADRCIFCDEKGNVVPADIITALLAHELLREGKGVRILADLRSSRTVHEVIAAAGGSPGSCRVGHSLIKAQMRKENAIFAGELSGHYYFAESGYTENTMLVLFYLLNTLERTGRTLSQLVEPLQTKRAKSDELNFTIEQKQSVIEQLKKAYADAEQSELDGLSISYPDWWFNVRPSNTEPLLRLNVEADTSELLDQKLSELKGHLGATSR